MGGEITQLLGKMRSGSSDARARIFELLYTELRDLAARKMRNERPDHTLQPTALVNEVYIHLAGNDAVTINDRDHLLAIAATAMRHLLIDHARGKNAAKRGSGWAKISLEENTAGTVSTQLASDVAIAVSRLAEFDPQQAQVMEMHLFGGQSKEDIADQLGVSKRTVERKIEVARLWLRRELSGDDDPGAMATN